MLYSFRTAKQQKVGRGFRQGQAMIETLWLMFILLGLLSFLIYYSTKVESKTKMNQFQIKRKWTNEYYK